jgi:hypothetical protein
MLNPKHVLRVATVGLRASHIFLVLSLVLGIAVLQASSASAGLIRGHVLDTTGAALPGATLTLSNDVTGFSAQTTSNPDGSFAFQNVPDNPYHVRAALDGFRPGHVDVEVHGNLPADANITLTASFSETTTVTADREPVALETTESTTHTDIDKSLINRFPATMSGRAFEQIVLSAPGFSADENGRYHFQGGHSQQLLVVDGQPIGDQVGITFSNSLNPAIAQGIEIVTGGVPAEYGEKAYGVINLTTRSALGQQGRFRGDAALGASSFSTYEGSADLGLATKLQGLFFNIDAIRSDRFLDPVSFDNLHNTGNTERLFARYDVQSGSSGDSVRVTGSTGKTDRDVTNLPSQQAAGQNERVETKDWNLNADYVHIVSNTLVYEVEGFARNNELALLSSPDDTPVEAAQNRALANHGAQASVTKSWGDHEIKAGAEIKSFPMNEHFSFLITDPTLNDPNSSAYNPNLAPYDGTRGGSAFVFQGNRTGTYGAAYAEDKWGWHNFTTTLGIRYDANKLFRTEEDLEPRLGAAYYIPATKTVLRASWDRMFVTPEYENILLSSSAAAVSIVPPEVQQSNALGFGELFNHSERQDVWNVGAQQGIGNGLRLDISYWNRQVVNAADQDQFFNTGIVFPLNFARGHLHGWNARVDAGPYDGFRGYASLGHVRAIYVPPLVGGLFLDSGELPTLVGGPFVIDHDQSLQAQIGAYYDLPNTGFWVGTTGRYDSGLVTDADSAAAILAGGPDTAYAAPFIDFASDPTRIKGRIEWNVSLGAKLQRYGLPFEAELDVLNLFGEEGLYNFQSTFGGTHVIPPREFAGHLKFTF